MEPIQIRDIVTVEVVENASQSEIISALRQQYLKQAQEQYPGAELLSSRLSAAVGAPDVTPIGGGYHRITVEMDGFVGLAQ